MISTSAKQTTDQINKYARNIASKLLETWIKERKNRISNFDKTNIKRQCIVKVVDSSKQGKKIKI